ncbi:MAG: hypothetical protein ABSA47_20330 [Verrucomicrobiota bacterium]|jgi:hypothetical protein
MAFLAALFTKGESSTVHHIRDLDTSEFAQFTKDHEDFLRMLERYSLLHIVDQNFNQIESFVKSVERPAGFNPSHVVTELNNRFMNYLSAGYALREHLGTWLKRDFPRDSEHVVRYPQVLTFMEKTSFEYAFVQDLRNFVQHCGFPIGVASLNQDIGGTTLRIGYYRDALLSLYKDWKKSHLCARTEKDFDLLNIVREAHNVTTKHFSGIIYLAYCRDLPAIDSRFTGFQKEAADIYPTAVARIVLSVRPSREGGKLSEDGGTVTWQDVPRDSFRLLGLRRSTFR